MLFRAALLASAVAIAAPALAQPKTTLNVGMAAQDIGSLDPHFAVRPSTASQWPGCSTAWCGSRRAASTRRRSNLTSLSHGRVRQTD